jgi:acetyl-CoA synthetase
MKYSGLAMSETVWHPDAAVVGRSQLTRFLQLTGHSNFAELHRYSTENIPEFTQKVIEFLQLKFQRRYTEILDISAGVPWAKWCADGILNISDSCIQHDAERTAVIWEGEEGVVRSLTYGELLKQVEAVATGLRGLGIGKGDAVAIHLPMIPETVVALIAAARIGAVAVPLFSGYGPSAIESRLRDVAAKAVITCDAFPRRGKPTPAQSVVAAAVKNCPSVESVIVVNRLGGGSAAESMSWDDLLSQTGAGISEPTSAEDPLLVLYTSGTTGKPKGILHSHCGFPIKAAQDMCFGTDVGPGTRISWVTDIGWMMGPWLIYGALILGGTIVLYDGAPDFPDAGRMWAFCERHAVEVLGISPTLVRALAVHGDEPVLRHNLHALRIFGSTGEPWNPAPWWWLFESVGRRRLPIVNYSGGTEISGGILMGNPLLPLKPCSFPAACPGIDADVVDESGNPVVTGAVGELIIRKPWIGMARGFLHHPQRYIDTYWSRWPGIWAHGDWAQRDEEGHWYILGRSDDTLKIAGKRVGPAEVESILVGHAAVVEAAVIGTPHDVKGECMVAFVVLTSDSTASPELADQLRTVVAEALGKPLRPEAVHFVPALPRTRNNKVMRRVIRAAFLGHEAGDLSALENPGAVDTIRQAGHDSHKSAEDPQHPSR